MKNKFLISCFAFAVLLRTGAIISNKSSAKQTKADDYEMYHLPVGSDVADISYQDPMVIKVTDDNREEILNTVIGNSKTGETYNPDSLQFNATPVVVETQGGRLLSISMRGDNNEPNDNNYAAMSLSDNEGKTWIDPVLIFDDNVVTTRIGDIYMWISPDNILFIVLRIGDNTQIDMDTGNQRGNIYSDHCSLVRIDNPDDDWADWHINYKMVMFDESGYSSLNTLRCMDVMDDNGHEIYCAIGQCGGRGSVSLKGKLFVSEDKGETWYLRSLLEFPSVNSLTFTEMTIAQLKNGDLWVLNRIEGGNMGGVGRFISHDFGKTWEYSTGMGSPLIGPGSHGYLRRLPSGNLVWATNHSTTTRQDLRIYLSEDDGETWPYQMNLDYRSASTYPVIYCPYVGNRDAHFYISEDNGRGGNRELRLSRLTEEDIKYGEPISRGSFVHGLISINKNYHQIVSSDENIPAVLRLRKDAFTRQDLTNYLPTRLNLTLDNGERIVVNGQWDLNDVMLGKIGTYYAKFSCVLPDRVVDGRNLFIVQIRVGQTGNEIKSIEETFSNSFVVSFGTTLNSITANLPTTIHAVNNYNMRYELHGSWVCESYRENKAGRYKIVFKASNAPMGLDDYQNLLTIAVRMEPNPNAVDSDIMEIVYTKDASETKLIDTLIVVAAIAGGLGLCLVAASFIKFKGKKGGNK